MLIHASCVAIENAAVLLAGPAGAGKSDLALRLIDEGAQLISDDQTLLMEKNGALLASPPDTIQGLFEVRHVGLLQMPHVPAAIVRLYIELVPLSQNIERLPDEEFMTLLDVRVRRLMLPSFAASTLAKIRAALKYPPAML